MARTSSSLGRPSDAANRFELSFYIGPCTTAEAVALGDTLLELSDAKAVGIGAIGMHAVDGEGNALAWPDQEGFV